MLVALVSAASTSPSPAKVPPASDTVALVRFSLSGSLTVTFDESTTVPAFSTNDTEASVPASVGGSLIAVMSIVLVAERVLLLPLLSVIGQVTVRVGSEAKSVGLSLGVVNDTVSSTDW